MEIQLELFYYTLVFVVGLIDYIDLVADSIMLEKIKPLYLDDFLQPAFPKSITRNY